MEKLSGYAFVAAMLSTGLATIAYLLYAVSGLRAARMQTASAGLSVSTGAMGFVSGPRTAAVGRYATMPSTYGHPSMWPDGYLVYAKSAPACCRRHAGHDDNMVEVHASSSR